MKLKCIVFACFFSMLSISFAENRHYYPQVKTSEITSANQNLNYPGVCDIEIINDSFDDINVHGRFEDGTYLIPFVIKHWGEPQYVSLFYYGSCHQGMDFYIETVAGKYKYNGFTPVGKTIKITNF